MDDCPNRTFVTDYYQNRVDKISYKKDCGVDIIFPNDTEFITNKVKKCGLGIACEFIPHNPLNSATGETGETAESEESGPFDLVPRSSITNTPLMLANSIGIFDPEYRGQVFAAFRCYADRDHPTTIDNASYIVRKGERLVQIVATDRKPIKVVLVNELTQTERGANGFGSTNK